MSSSNKSPRRESNLSRIPEPVRNEGDEHRPSRGEIDVATPRIQPLEMEMSTTPKSSPLQNIAPAVMSSPPHPQLTPSRSNSISSNSFSTANGSTHTFRSTRNHKGFSTPFSRILQTLSSPSVIAHDGDNDYELSASHIRTDLCSLSLFGILQSDHTRYLFTHNRPPTLFKRLCLHIIIPVGIFVTAGYMSGHIPNDYVNNLVCTSLVWCVICWICVSCFRGRKKRVMVREEILWRLRRREEKLRKRREESRRLGRGMKRSFGLLNSKDGTFEDDDYEYYSEDEECYEQQAKTLGLTELGQTRWEMNCAHRMCGCYPSDVGSSSTSSDNDVPQGNDYVLQNNSHNSESEKINAFCCSILTSPCCSCIPCGNGSYGCHPQFCGFCAIAQEARESNQTIPRHLRMIDYITMEPFLLYYPQILKLRRTQSQGLMSHCRALSRLSVVLLRAWCVILFLLLGLSLWRAVSYWKLHDMMVLFATFIQSFLVMWAAHWGWHRFDLSIDAVIKYFATGFALCTCMAFCTELLIAGLFRLIVMSVIFTLGVTEVVDNGYGGGGMNVKFDEWGSGSGGRRSLSEESDVLYGFFERHPFAQVIYVLVSSYLIAGFIDELCKYFGFLMLDHPDFCSEKDLTNAHASLPLQLLRDRGYDDPEHENGVTTIVRDEEATSLAEFDPSKQIRSPCSIRAGVTVAMVAVALGFACCENILHIFIYNRSSLRSEIGVLIVKSLFPVHPLCAAIQSIFVCKRDLEKKKIGVGRIVLASVILHGTYDAALLFINQSWQRSHKENYFYEGTNGKIGIALTSGVTSMLILTTGIVYYMVLSRAQYSRLRGKQQRAEIGGISLESGFLT